MSDVLGKLGIGGSLYFSTELTAPWGIQVPRFENVARFHLAVRGAFWARVEGDDVAIRLDPGDVIFVPGGRAHALTDAPETPPEQLDRVLEETGYPGHGALVYGGPLESKRGGGGFDDADSADGTTRIVCGHLSLDADVDHPLLTELPSSIVLRWDDYAGSSAIDDVFRFIVREVQTGRAGFESVVNRMSEVLFIEAVRFWAEREPEAGFLSVLGDPSLAPALAAVHADPTRRWTVDELARVASLGRTAFSERFRAGVGETPIHYVTRWRMQLAKERLIESTRSVESIGYELGYDSAASFSRAFRKTVGRSPGAFRRNRRTESEGNDVPSEQV
ncbi:MAG: AraC family transcriptional regulator [Gemmatimonadetes bacterium]|nr:AraC family transcriptional regulator [Gemmatimonadota bacterium]